jgi:hypothetical protein
VTSPGGSDLDAAQSRGFARNPSVLVIAARDKILQTRRRSHVTHPPEGRPARPKLCFETCGLLLGNGIWIFLFRDAIDRSGAQVSGEANRKTSANAGISRVSDNMAKEPANSGKQWTAAQDAQLHKEAAGMPTCVTELHMERSEDAGVAALASWEFP